MPGLLADPLGSQFRASWLQTQFLQALNRGDAAAAAVYLADDAVYSISDGVGLCGPLPCVRRSAIQPEFDRQVLIHVSYLPIGLDASSNTITGRFAITSDNITATGAQRVLGTVTSETRTDKLSYVRLSLERDDTQTAQYLAWAMRQPTGGATAPAATGPTPAGGAAAPATGQRPRAALRPRRPARRRRRPRAPSPAARPHSSPRSTPA